MEWGQRCKRCCKEYHNRRDHNSKAAILILTTRVFNCLYCSVLEKEVNLNAVHIYIHSIVFLRCESRFRTFLNFNCCSPVLKAGSSSCLCVVFDLSLVYIPLQSITIAQLLQDYEPWEDRLVSDMVIDHPCIQHTTRHNRRE